MLMIYMSIVLCLMVDQFVKWLTVNHLALHTGVPLIKGILSWYYTQNDGAAWGILSGNRWLFYVITIVFVVSFVWWFHKGTKRKLIQVAYVLIMAGALGNFIDRVRLGYVIDMLQFDWINFPIFNIADMCLTCGVVLILIETLFLERKHE